ncbi:unnamed protein product [Auanema sp. JU1783]|nr:unnamed protein product [Auanema sp. JU1783]
MSTKEETASNEDNSTLVQAGTKRAQDTSDGPVSKKAHLDGEENQLAVKILIPSAAVGAIIGKGGEAMRALKTDNNCRVQMSKSSDTYPGTSERVCLVKGKLQNVVSVVEAIMEKIREKCDGVAGSDAFDHKGANRGSEIKIVMPNTSAGMVIGKAGANIKDIREAYGCQIQVFPKAGSPEAKNSLERVVTLAHEEHGQLILATSKVLEKVAADPHHSSEINKEDFGGKGANSSFTSNSGYNNGSGGNYGGSGGGNAPYNNYGYGGQNNSGGGKFQYNPMNGLGNNELLAFLDNLQNTLRTSGFNEASVAEVMQAMQVLAKYNIMGLGLGLGVAAMAQMRSGQEQPAQLPANHGVAGFGDQGYQADPVSFR